MPGSVVARPHRPALSLGLVLACGIGPALAQETAGPRLSITPSLSIGQTLSDHHLAESGNEPRSEAVTSIAAGVRIASRSRALQGTVDYSLTGLLHARDSSANDVQNRLAAGLWGELIERHLSFNATATIAQQPISALEVQTPDGIATTRNRTEIRSLSMSPTLQGRLGGVVDLQAVLSGAVTDTGSEGAVNDASDSKSAAATVQLASTGGGRLGWSLRATHAVTSFAAGRKTTEERVAAGLNLRPDVDWALSLRAGTEANDFQRSDGRDRYDTWGLGLLWTPSPRTRVAIDGDRRAFGHSHSVALEHRSRRTVWRYSDSQDVTRGSAETAAALVGAYDLFFQLYASQEPDPVLRAQLVDGLLQRNGLTRDSQIGVGFLSSAVTVQRQQQLSVALEAQRTTFVVAGFASKVRRADTLSPGVDDTQAGNAVRQRGLSFTVSHRLTATAVLSLAASGTRNDEDAGRRTDLRTISAFWSDQLGRRTSFSLGLRHSEYDADLDPYTENALIANLSLRF